MDVAALSMGLSLSSVKMEAGMSVLKKAMDNGSQNAEALIEMMMRLQPHLGQNIDVYA